MIPIHYYMIHISPKCYFDTKVPRQIQVSSSSFALSHGCLQVFPEFSGKCQRVFHWLTGWGQKKRTRGCKFACHMDTRFWPWGFPLRSETWPWMTWFVRWLPYLPCFTNWYFLLLFSKLTECLLCAKYFVWILSWLWLSLETQPSWSFSLARERGQTHK